MAAVAPPPVHTAAASAQPPPRKRNPLAWISAKGCHHALKLRHSFKLDDRTRMELGVDLDVLEEDALRQMLHSAAPWAALLHRLDPEDEGKGALEMTPQWLTYNRRFQLGPKDAWWGTGLDTKLGLTYSGSPHVEVAITNLKLALPLAAALLYAGKPLTVKRKEVGAARLAVHFPITHGGSKRDYSLQERVELDASLQRDGNSLRLQFNRIDGVLRLRQDD